jgi:neopullulanase
MMRATLCCFCFLLFGCDETNPVTADVPSSGDGDLGLDVGPNLDVTQDGAIPVRSCRTSFVLNLGRSARSISVAGEWNAFSTTATPMNDTNGNGVFRTEVNIAPGDYGYKFVIDGNEWILDPNTIERKNVGGQENSRVRVADCNLPTLQVLRQSATADGTLEVDVQYTDGNENRGPDAASIRVTMSPTALPPSAVTFDRGVIRIRARSLTPTKYTLRVNASTTTGRRANELVVPMWVERDAYQWGDGPMYFVFTDRFRNGDRTNDGRVGSIAPIADWAGGDFAGITAALREGYFDRLGVRVLWLSPVNSNTAMSGRGSDSRNYAGYHGYWVNQPRQTDSHWGSLDALRELNAEAHRRGIRVLYDLVHNQLHREHPYFRDHQRDGWFNGDGSCVCGGPSCSWDTRTVDCWFTNYLPDVNWANMGVADQMVDDAWWWLVETDADGFRVDAVKHMNFLSTTNLRARLDQYETGNAQMYTVGETFTGADGHDLVRRYVGRGALHAQFDFPLFWSIRRAFAQNEGSMGDLENAVQTSERSYGDAPMSPFLGNHDVTRFMSEAAGQLTGNPQEQAYNAPPGLPDSDLPYQRMALAWTFTLTQRGVPLIYYGDEIGIPGAADPDNRRTMRFGDELSARERTLMTHVQTIGNLRASHSGLRRGLRRSLHTDNDGYVYARGTAADTAIIALNRGTTSRTVTVRVPAELNVPDNTTFRDALGGPSLTVNAGSMEVPLRPRSSAIYIRM